ncbi:LysR substrate-binding domain-containing protein [Marinobacterium jannaschii]|uniref:LysR substrate-binding domain-containing protein n=1 Tax=Marinobacterium jannaschii TaxID=64970 RepID=UPI000481E94E|nr:LysR substrate-binding domain-containing protein [Marinobacterium jannaschii]
MENLSRALPPLNALRTFEAAGRLGSFKAAADELCVTQAAVSRQIQVLEDYYGQALFLRGNRKVDLTVEGRFLYLAANSALRQIAASSVELKRRKGKEHLTLATTTSFSRLWLLPRLKLFHKLHPELQLHLVSSEGSPESHESFDAAVTLGYEEHPDFVAEFLFSEDIFPVCTPGFLAKHPAIDDLDGLLQVPLLNLSADHWKARLWPAMDWNRWLEHFGYSLDQCQPVMSFSHFPLLVDAVMEEMGVGLAWHHLVQNKLESGALIRPLQQRWRADDRCHYFVCRRERAGSPEIATLREWFLEQTRPLRERDLAD